MHDSENRPAGNTAHPHARERPAVNRPPMPVADASESQRLDHVWELTGQLRDDPDIDALLQMARRSVRPAPRAWHRGLAVAATLLLALGVLFFTVSSPSTPATLTLIAPVGEQLSTELPDASRVRLNSDTRLVATFSENSRTVTLLSGEATFEVERDGRPFEVHTHDGVTRVLGTVFNVQLTENGATRVSVLEGKVQVEGARQRRGAPVELAQGQAVNYDHQGVSSVNAADTDRILSWHSGRLRFQEWPLSRVIAEYNRYTPNKVRVEGGEDILFSGSFTLENKDELLTTLENVYGVRIHALPPPG